MKFKPKPIPTFITIAGLILLLSLGTWQMKRLEWKNSHIQQINEKAKMPAVFLPEQINDLQENKYRRVKVVGKFDHDKEVHLFVGSRSPRGRPGYQILTPLKRQNGSYILIDRGWVEADIKARENRPETLIEGEVEIEGLIHLGETPGRFTPENDITKNLWFWIDIEAIEKYAGINLQKFYVRALKKDKKDVYPIASQEFIKIRNDHLQYAITWYSLAFILLVIYFIYHRKQDK
jgi:surfeit locus 1 family protein